MLTRYWSSWFNIISYQNWVKSLVSARSRSKLGRICVCSSATIQYCSEGTVALWTALYFYFFEFKSWFSCVCVLHLDNLCIIHLVLSVGVLSSKNWNSGMDQYWRALELHTRPCENSRWEERGKSWTLITLLFLFCFSRIDLKLSCTVDWRLRSYLRL